MNFVDTSSLPRHKILKALLTISINSICMSYEAETLTIHWSPPHITTLSHHLWSPSTLAVTPYSQLIPLVKHYFFRHELPFTAVDATRRWITCHYSIGSIFIACHLVKAIVVGLIELPVGKNSNVSVKMLGHRNLYGYNSVYALRSMVGYAFSSILIVKGFNYPDKLVQHLVGWYARALSGHFNSTMWSSLSSFVFNGNLNCASPRRKITFTSRKWHQIKYIHSRRRKDMKFKLVI